MHWGTEISGDNNWMKIACGYKDRKLWRAMKQLM